jgi:hypothetical protein
MPPSAVTSLARLRRVGSGRLALVAELDDGGSALPTRITRLSVEGNHVAILHCRRTTAESCLWRGLGHGAMNRCHGDVDTALDGVHGRHRAWAKAHRRGWLASTGDERQRSSQCQGQEHDENCQAAHEINCSVAGFSWSPPGVPSPLSWRGVRSGAIHTAACRRCESARRARQAQWLPSWR